MALPNTKVEVILSDEQREELEAGWPIRRFGRMGDAGTRGPMLSMGIIMARHQNHSSENE